MNQARRVARMDAALGASGGVATHVLFGHPMWLIAGAFVAFLWNYVGWRRTERLTTEHVA